MRQMRLLKWLLHEFLSPPPRLLALPHSFSKKKTSNSQWHRTFDLNIRIASDRAPNIVKFYIFFLHKTWKILHYRHYCHWWYQKYILHTCSDIRLTESSVALIFLLVLTWCLSFRLFKWQVFLELFIKLLYLTLPLQNDLRYHFTKWMVHYNLFYEIKNLLQIVSIIFSFSDAEYRIK